MYSYSTADSDFLTFAFGVSKVFVNNNHVGSESVSGAVMRIRAVFFGFGFGFDLTAKHGIRSRIRIRPDPDSDLDPTLLGIIYH
jgi:hypothetical protein